MGGSVVLVTLEDAKRSRSQIVILNRQVPGIANQANRLRSQIVTLNQQLPGSFGWLMG